MAAEGRARLGQDCAWLGDRALCVDRQGSVYVLAAAPGDDCLAIQVCSLDPSHGRRCSVAQAHVGVGEPLLRVRRGGVGRHSAGASFLAATRSGAVYQLTLLDERGASALVYAPDLRADYAALAALQTPLARER